MVETIVVVMICGGTTQLEIQTVGRKVQLGLCFKSRDLLEYEIMNHDLTMSLV